MSRAEAGENIYCEKPLSLTVKEGRAMVDATRTHNRVFQTGSMQRLTKEFTTAVQPVRSEAVKKVYVSDNHYRDFLGAIKSRKAPICDV